MFSTRFALLFFALFIFSACGDTMGDLQPADTDKTGSGDGRTASLFSAPAIDGTTFNLEDELATHKGVLLYFTQWCPICDSHMSHFSRNQIRQYPEVLFVAVDYVSGSVEQARASASASGYANGPFTVVADIDNIISGMYGGTMAKTVLIGSDGIIRFDEIFKTDDKLDRLLADL
jgi:peroxiredoxin